MQDEHRLTSPRTHEARLTVRSGCALHFGRSPAAQRIIRRARKLILSHPEHFGQLGHLRVNVGVAKRTLQTEHRFRLGLLINFLDISRLAMPNQAFSVEGTVPREKDGEDDSGGGVFVFFEASRVI